ncbi:MAG: MBL fold metallo-hydrolase [Planctomycetota bacterium]
MLIFEQFYLSCLAQASYLIGDSETGVAVVVDPRRDVDVYFDAAEAQGLRIEHVLLTHFHADFLAGHIELRDRVGAKLHLGAAAQADYKFLPMIDGDELSLGAVRLWFLATPGHTPESTSILVFDGVQKNPHAVLTGDTLFIGDVGRPDLMASIGISAEELAGDLFQSLHHKLLMLPDETLVYPGHGAGSMCGKSLSSETVSTIGAQRATNYALQPMSKSDFIELVTSNLPKTPGYFAYNADLNRRERPNLESALRESVRGLDLEEFLALRDRSGAWVVDSRSAGDFAPAHLAGSLNVGLDGMLATWAGSTIPSDQPLMIVAEPGREHETILRFGRIGYDRVLGFLEGGFGALAEHPDQHRQIGRVSVEGLFAERQIGDAAALLDVRNEGEWEQTKIEGSFNIPLRELENRASELPQNRALVVHCRTGYRSSLAVSILQRLGIMGARDLVGGIVAWEENGQPVVRPPAG